MSAEPLDLWTQLPFELFLSILEYLPLNYVWRLRSVCKAWQHVLSSHSAEDLSHRRHETHVKTISCSLDQRKALLRAHHTGRPAGVHRMIRVDDTDHPAEPLLHGDRLAWVSYNDSVMSMFLATGEQHKYRTSKVFLLCLTGELLAYTTSTSLHCVPVTGMPFTLPLPEGLVISHLAGEGETLVLLAQGFQKEVMIIARDKIMQQFTLRNRFPGRHIGGRPLTALLVDELTCHVLTHWRMEDPELDQYGMDCLRVISVDMESKAQTTQDIWYEAQKVEHSGNDFRSRMTVRAVGLSKTYHVMVRPYSISPVPHDLLLTFRPNVELEVIHNGDETLAVWKDNLYECPRLPAFVHGSLSAMIRVSKLEGAHSGWILALIDAVNEYMDCRLLVNEHYLVLMTPDLESIVYTFDETYKPIPLQTVNLDKDDDSAHGWLDASSLIMVFTKV